MPYSIQASSSTIIGSYVQSADTGGMLETNDLVFHLWDLGEEVCYRVSTALRVLVTGKV